MILYYYKDPVGNFGDDLNQWLWPQLFQRPIEQYFDEDTLFLGIGSILNQKVPEFPRTKVVFGSGCGYGSIPILTEAWRFFCVRGPLTASLLELPAHLAICDSAILVRTLLEPARRSEYEAAFMPHHVTAQYHDWRSVCESLAIRYIDPADPVEQTLQTIRKSSVVISEAMHGAIIADALRVPWVPVRTRQRILDFKWRDWSSSLAIDHEFEWLPPVWNGRHASGLKRRLHPIAKSVGGDRLRWLVHHGRRRLSDDATFQHVYNRLVEAFKQLNDEATSKEIALR